MTCPGRVAVLLCVALMPACAKPHALAFPQPPTEMSAHITVGPVTVLDAQGTPMDPQPAVEVTAEPDDVLEVVGWVLHPKKTGTARVTLRIPKTAVSKTFSINVRLPDRVDLQCVDSRECQVPVGRTLRVKTAALLQGVPLENIPVTVATTDEKVLRAAGPEVFDGVLPGKATLTASTAAGLRSTRDVSVYEVPDTVTLQCAPGFSTPGESARTRCTLTQGQAMKFAWGAQKAGQGMAPTVLRWTSQEPRVATVDGSGRVEAKEPGLSTVVLAFNGANATAEVDVVGDPQVSVKLGATCSGINRYGVRLYRVDRRSPHAVVNCETPGGVKCILRTADHNLTTANLQNTLEACCCR